jgi:hypothetical protein
MTHVSTSAWDTSSCTPLLVSEYTVSMREPKSWRVASRSLEWVPPAIDASANIHRRFL